MAIFRGTHGGVAATNFKIYIHSEKITKPFRRESENSDFASLISDGINGAVGNKTIMHFI